MDPEKSICVANHLGLGDHIICNAIYRRYAEQYKLVCLPVAYHNVDSVTFMLRDLDNVVIRPVENFEDMMFFFLKVWAGKQLTLGDYAAATKGFDRSQWDREFYRHAEIPIMERWINWKCIRDLATEEKPPAEEGKYIFLHQDESRGFIITPEKLAEHKDPDLKAIVQPSNTGHIFKWWGVIEKAEEIHCFDSSFSHFVDCIPLPKNPKLFLYDIKNEPLATYDKDWKVIPK